MSDLASYCIHTFRHSDVLAAQAAAPRPMSSSSINAGLPEDSACQTAVGADPQGRKPAAVRQSDPAIRNLLDAALPYLELR